MANLCAVPVTPGVAAPAFSFKEKPMTVTKTIDLSGTSTQSIEAAVDEAVSRAALTISDVEEFEIDRITGSVKDGRVDEYRVWLKVTFVVKERLHE
jgi:flavin-binding protein dodecin